MATGAQFPIGIQVNNEPDQIQLRKLSSRLSTIGKGVIMLCVWDVFRSVIFYISGITSGEVLEAASHAAEGTEIQIPLAVTLTMSAVVLLIDLWIRTYAGRSAIAISRGEKRGRAFTICTVILILGSIFAIGAWCATFYTGLRNTDQKMLEGLPFSSLIVEITSLILLIEMLISAGKVRKLNKNGAS